MGVHVNRSAQSRNKEQKKRVAPLHHPGYGDRVERNGLANQGFKGIENDREQSMRMRVRAKEDRGQRG